jgi:hypothetical protein
MAGLFEKNPKRKVVTQHTDKYYTPKKLPEEEIIKGRLVDIGKDGAVSSTQLIVNEKLLGDEKVLEIAGLIDKDGKLIQGKARIEKLTNNAKGYNLYAISNSEDLKKIGEITNDAKVSISGLDNLNDQIIFDKDSRVSRILLKKDGLALAMDRYGAEINTNQKDTRGHRNFNINTQQGVENLQSQPARSSMKGAREAARIVMDLKETLSVRNQEDRKVALDIAKKARANKRSQGR